MPEPVTQFQLTTVWTLTAPIGSVWSELSRPEEWPQWWHGILAVQLLEPGGANGLGAYRRVTWRGALPRRVHLNLRTVKVQPRALIEMVADGDLSGVGRWQLARVGALSEVRHDWIVNVPLPGIPLLDALAGWMFRWNHRSLMGKGGRGLQHRVGIR